MEARGIALFIEVYDERFLAQHGPLPAYARHAFEAYLRCGRALFGFARIRCDACGNEMLLPFSCQRVGLCPSCQQKRAEVLQRFLTDQIIEPVPHRQLVFVLPRRLRQSFYRDAELLGGLCRAAAQATVDFYSAGLARDDLKVGLVIMPQFFGDKVNPHIHLHCLCTDGAFDPEGTFHRLPIDANQDAKVLCKLFEKKILDLLVKHNRLSLTFRDEMLTWKHTGFSVDASVSQL